MSIILIGGAIISYLIGFVVLAGAKSVIHEISAFALFINGTIALSGGLICERLLYLKWLLKEIQEDNNG